jgi:hypothetical protein
MIRYLWFISLLFVACSRNITPVQKTKVDGTEFKKFIPQFRSVLYDTHIDVIGKHLSGLLFIKNLPDNSRHFVFTNEMGLSYFDFAFYKDGDFKVISIIKQMNKKAVIKTLQKDFNLAFMQNLNYSNSYSANDTTAHYIFSEKKYVRHYIINKDGKVENATGGSENKTIVTVSYFHVGNVPDSIAIVHQNFNFTIALKQIIR